MKDTVSFTQANSILLGSIAILLCPTTSTNPFSLSFSLLPNQWESNTQQTNYKAYKFNHLGIHRYLQWESIHVCPKREDGATAGPDGGHDSGPRDRPGVLNTEGVELGPDQFTRLVLLEGELRVLVDPPPNSRQPIEELRLASRFQELTGRVLQRPRPGQGEEDKKREEEEASVVDQRWPRGGAHGCKGEASETAHRDP